MDSRIAVDLDHGHGRGRDSAQVVMRHVACCELMNPEYDVRLFCSGLGRSAIDVVFSMLSRDAPGDNVPTDCGARQASIRTAMRTSGRSYMIAWKSSWVSKCRTNSPESTVARSSSMMVRSRPGRPWPRCRKLERLVRTGKCEPKRGALPRHQGITS